MNNLILVRHGQSIWNKERRFTGWADVNLTEQGILEAKLAGNLIKNLNINFDIYFTSKLKRAINTIEIILKILNQPNVNIIKSDSLNERHYGGLTSLNKDETIKKYGEKQVKIWRRSFDIAPPPIDSNNPYKDKINSDILSESLKDTFNRVIPFYNEKIKPLVISKKNILIVFHGNSCRALLKKILDISNEKIIQLEVPTGNPLQIIFDSNLKVKKINYLDENRAKKLIF